ncbi:MAG: DegT/DnrJ/EryC1/StrS family aminotransferase [Anaerolineales bacterium]|nr:DegT/DnrJ/EryC1/StrS family aminotransferase [Anaerolineales bacterium]
MSSPDITQAEIDAVLKVLHSTDLSMGGQIQAFEDEMARIAGTKFAAGVSSGTAGLHLSVIAAGIGEGDLVVTTPFSFVASSNCILYERAVPVFADVNDLTGNLDWGKVDETVEAIFRGGKDAERCLPRNMAKARTDSRELKALLPANVFMQAADYDQLRDIAHRHNLVIVEDACETIGAGYKGRPAGSLGDIAVMAFYPNKQMTTGEGGMVVTNNEDWIEQVRSLRNQGRKPGGMWLEHDRLGYNYRLDEMSAAFGLAQARRLGDLLEKRSRVAFWYEERLRDVETLRLPKIAPFTTTPSWFVYVVRILPPADRDRVIDQLADQGVPSRKYFSPIHLQSFYREQFGYRPGDFPVTERLAQQSLALPFSSVMTEDEVDTVSFALRKALG